MPEIADWLKTLGMSEYTERFAENGIDISVLRHRAAISEAGVGFVVAGGDAAELFEALEEVLDQVAPFVDLGVVGDGRLRSALAGMTAAAPRSFRVARNALLSKALSAMSAPNATPVRSGSAPTLSCRWPRSRTKRAKLPSASTRATILVVSPPRDLPMA
jgi:hypothetical protein